MIRAQQNNISLRVRRHELIDRAQYETVLSGLARRVRDQLLTASSRHAAILANDAGLETAALAHALDRIMRVCLHNMSAQYGSTR